MAERRIDAVFGALADGTRRELVRQLSERPATPTELAGRLPVTRQAVSKHLDVLREAGLVESARDGRHTVFTLTPRPLADAASWMALVGARWDTRLDTLRRQLGRRR